MSETAEFNRFRQELNARILDAGNLEVRRFFALDERVYADGVLDHATKEMMGLAASLVMRCDDCIRYHILQCRRAGLSNPAFFEIFAVALVVGGSIVIPHLRRAVAFLDGLDGESDDPGAK